MIHFALCAALAAAPATKVAVPGFAGLDVDPKMVSFLSEHFAQGLAARGLQTLSPAEIVSVLGLERQRQLAGCADSGCMVELAGALGVDAVVTATIAHVGNFLQLDVKVIGANDAKTLSAASARVESEDKLAAALDELAPRVAREVDEKLGRAVPVAASPGARHWAWIPAGAAGALAGGGAVSIGLASNRYDAILRHPPALATAQASASQGQTFQTVGWVAFGAGAACAVAAVGLLAFGGRDSAVAVVPEARGATVAVSGRWP